MMIQTKLIKPIDSNIDLGVDFDDWLSGLVPSIEKLLNDGNRFNFHKLIVVIKSQDILASRTSKGNGLEIYLSLNYLVKYSNDKNIVIREAKGLIVYQVMDMYLQLNAKGIPSHVQSGLCDYARLALNVDPPHWSKSRSLDWRAGFSTTALFFQFIQTTIYDKFIQEFYSQCCSLRYKDTFFKSITAQEADHLYYIYAGFKYDFVQTTGNPLCQIVNSSVSDTFDVLCPQAQASYLYEIFQKTMGIVYPTPTSNSPKVDILTLFVKDMDGVAHTNVGSEPYSYEIHLSVKYISSFLSKHGLAESKKELYGVLLHEMVHVVQSNGYDTLHGALVEGIADYFRLVAGYESVNWAGKPNKSKKWQDGYADCAYFLKWIVDTKVPGFVHTLNASLYDEMYSSALWIRLAGADIEKMFKEYLDSLPSRR